MESRFNCAEWWWCTCRLTECKIQQNLTNKFVGLYCSLVDSVLYKTGRFKPTVSAVRTSHWKNKNVQVQCAHQD